MPAKLSTTRLTRRELLQTGAGAAALVALPRPLVVHFGRTPEPVPPIDDPQLKALVLRGLEAAKSAGARYADVRLVHRHQRAISATSLSDDERLSVGVRALVEGYWGFAASPLWSPDELARLGREAVEQAKTLAGWKPRAVELAPTPVVQDGHWAPPLRYDPFAVPFEEWQDYFAELEILGRRLPGVSGSTADSAFWVEHKAFGSTEGSYCTQRKFRQLGGSWSVQGPSLLYVGTAFAGAESLGGRKALTVEESDAAHYERCRENWERARRAPGPLPERPMTLGRYDAVFSANAMAELLSRTLGQMTQLDVALGYEANAAGTGYLNQPLTMLGRYQVGAPLLTVTANRSDPAGAASVAWDDEGVSPEPDGFPLVKDGVLADFQTNRESAGWLKDTYATHRRPFRSHGCAAAQNGEYAPLVFTPNLVMAPGKEALSEAELLKSLGTGLYFSSFSPMLDFQGVNAYSEGGWYAVVNGKMVARLTGGAALMRIPEFWKGLLALGGPASAARYTFSGITKGEPPQGGGSYDSVTLEHSVTAVPALVKQITVLDPTRKA